MERTLLTVPVKLLCHQVYISTLQAQKGHFLFGYDLGKQINMGYSTKQDGFVLYQMPPVLHRKTKFQSIELETHEPTE